MWMKEVMGVFLCYENIHLFPNLKITQTQIFKFLQNLVRLRKTSSNNMARDLLIVSITNILNSKDQIS